MSSYEDDLSPYGFNWQIFEEAEAFLEGLIESFVSHHNRAGELASSLKWVASLRLFDLIDHMVVPEEELDLDQLDYLEFREDGKAETDYGARCYRHVPSSLFPILLRPGHVWEMAIRTDDMDSFTARHKKAGEVLGIKGSRYRWLDVVKSNDRLLTAVERRGYDGFSLAPMDDLDGYEAALEAFQGRPREFDDDAEGMGEIRALVESVVKDLDRARAADAWFVAERKFWQSSNRAARVQRQRQDQVGLGWANHDHHTYRCSRELFSEAIAVLRLLGMEERECFHAGATAGWGAQVMEQRRAGVVVFADVDMGVEEQEIDFASEGLEPRDELGTIGLWVGLHGESMLQGGLHHLAARFRFDQVVQDLDTRDVDTMAPFSDLEFLRQAFTRAEVWRLDERRVRRLLEGGQISEERFERYGEEGAIGSHMELIDRRWGFKGFNQDSVDVIIQATDPRGA